MKRFNPFLSQTDVSIEVVVVNDGSTDDSAAIVESIADPRVRLFNKPNGGVSSARNFGCNEARADFIAFVDADDTWHRQHLANLKQLVNQYPDKGAFGSAYRFFIEDAEIEKELQQTLDLTTAKIETVDIPAFAKRTCDGILPFCTSSVAVCKSALEETGGFNEAFSHGEDVAVWLEIVARRGGVTSSLNTSYYHRGDDDSLTARLVKLDGTIDLVKKLLEKENWSRDESDAFKAISDRFALSHAASAIRSFGDRSTSLHFLSCVYRRNSRWLKVLCAVLMPRFILKRLG